MGVDPIEYAEKLKTERFHLQAGNTEKEVQGNFPSFDLAQAAAIYNDCTWWAITDWNTGQTIEWGADDEKVKD